MAEWGFLTNHARVLIVIAGQPDARLRDIALELDITERATQRIVNDLVDAGYLSRIREGRRNRYEVHHELPIRAPQARNTEIGEVLQTVLANQSGR